MTGSCDNRKILFLRMLKSPLQALWRSNYLFHTAKLNQKRKLVQIRRPKVFQLFD